jgi:dihydroorotase
MTYDLLIKGGTLIDPAQNIHTHKDVAFAGGIVAAAGDDLPPGEAGEVLDASGRVLAPGMIDLHVHVFAGVSHYGIEPDPTCLAKGATTVVDAGSAGADTFPGFRKYVIDVSETRIFARLNISSQGMVTREIGELHIPEYANVSKACEMIEQHRDVILGVKVRLTRNSIVSEEAGMLPLYRAREAADAAGMPLMVHPQGAWCGSIDEILAVMRDRDILTHCFHGMSCGILDDQGKVRSSVREAMERGVVFDVGHGAGSFSWDVVERALEQSVEPQTISSDLHIYNLNGPVYDLATVVSKFLHLGMGLDEAIAKVTVVPAQVLLMSEQIGTLRVGAWGDAVVFDLREGQFQFMDTHGQMRIGRRKLVPVAVVKGGRVHSSNTWEARVHA